MMSFLETPRFPDDISYGATGGPGFLTSVDAVESGYEFRDAIWQYSRARYDISHAARTQAQALTLCQFFYAVQGRAHGFRYKDWLDYSATTSDGLLGDGVGNGKWTYQLHKKYTAGALSTSRIVRKPVSGTVAVYKAGALQTAGSGAGQYALDTTTGVVTFVASATQTISSVTVGASTTVVNVSSALTGAASNRLIYLANIGGTAGAYLNGSTWTIIDVIGTAISISANTYGMSATPASGNAYMYPQASESLKWSGEFDVPVRFDTDHLPQEIIARNNNGYVVGWAGIPLLEIRT